VSRTSRACVMPVVTCLANWVRNRTLHCAIIGPVLWIAGGAFLLSAVAHVRLDTSWVWPFVAIGTGVAFLITDVFDLHTVQPREVAAVVEAISGSGVARPPRAEEIKMLSSNYQGQYEGAVQRTSEVRAENQIVCMDLAAFGVNRLRAISRSPAKQRVILAQPCDSKRGLGF
jgi:hypothetical protein